MHTLNGLYQESGVGWLPWILKFLRMSSQRRFELEEFLEPASPIPVCSLRNNRQSWKGAIDGNNIPRSNLLRNPACALKPAGGTT